MHSLLDIQEGASEEELVNAYKGKRQRYLKEIKSTSAKPRIRLLKDKLDRLESAYKAYAKEVCDSSKSVKQSLTAETTKDAESGGQKMKSRESSPDSHPVNRVYPIITVEGMLISKEVKKGFSFWVNGQETKLNEDESIDIPPDLRKIRIEHPGIELWEQSFNEIFSKAVPFPVNLTPVKSKFSLHVIPPDVRFRLFVDGVEHPRTHDDAYEIVAFKPKLITLQAEGYEEYNFHTEFCKEEQRMEFELLPKLECSDLITAKAPFSVRHAETKDEVSVVEGDEFVLGRAAEASVPLCGPQVSECNPEHLFISRKHFCIRKENKKVILIDHSSNGTFLNGKKILGEQELPAGVVHELGIYNPHKKKFLLRKSLYVEVSEPEFESDDCEPLFVIFEDILPVNKTTTHLLLFKVFSRMREDRNNSIEFLRKILPYIGTDSVRSSFSDFRDEIRSWKTKNS